MTDSSCMETKSTKQTFNGYTNWQTYNLVNWALDSYELCSFEILKEDFMFLFSKCPGIIQDQIDLTEINWDEIQEAMEGKE